MKAKRTLSIGNAPFTSNHLVPCLNSAMLYLQAQMSLRQVKQEYNITVESLMAILQEGLNNGVRQM